MVPVINTSTFMYDQTRYDSHFGSLPVELLVEVFRHCAPPYPRCSTKNAPLLLCQVCTSWRSLIRSTPMLWSRFEIDVRDFSDTNSERNWHFLNSVDLWLKRSTTYTLSIRIIHQPIDCVTDLPLLQLLAILIPHTHRLRDIDFLAPSNVNITFCQRLLLPKRPPSLQSLSLVTSKGQNHSDLDLDIQTIGVPWCQLTSLYLHLHCGHILTLDECLDILMESANLVNCTINADSAFDGNRNFHIVALPQLEYFHLIVERGGQAANIGSTSTPQSHLISFLEQLQLVNLRTLAVEWLVQGGRDGRYWMTPGPSLISKLLHLGTTLQRLTLTYLPLVEQEILDYLSQLPNLLQLDLRFSLAEGARDPISDTFLRACTISSYPNFLPLLNTIHLQCRGDLCTTSLLIGLIHSRWMPGNDSKTRLKAFSFVSMKPISSTVHQRVKGWNRAGLLVDIDSVTVF